MFQRALVLLSLVLAACKPDTADETTLATSTTGAGTLDETTIDGTTAGSSTTDAPTSTTGTTGATDSDQQICEAFCASYTAGGCGECDVPTCVMSIGFAFNVGCGEQFRAMRACEGMHPIGLFCEAAECAAEYLQDDICDGGGCTHFGAVYGSIFGDDECVWDADDCYGHELDMVCTPTADAQCSCRVDGVEVATCPLGADLVPQTCGDFEVFTGCCTDAFVAALDL